MSKKRSLVAGGSGGIKFLDYDIPKNCRLSEIHIFAKHHIDSIKFIYKDAKGKTSMMPPIGGLGGFLHVTTLDDDEYLTGISGQHEWCINSLVLHTNKRDSEVIGRSEGDHFVLNVAKGEQVTGLFGRFDWYIDSLGLVSISAPKKKAASKPKAKPAVKKASPKKAVIKKKKVVTKKVAAKTIARPATKKERLTELQKVEGIGPKIAGLLIDDGVKDLQDLSKAKITRLRNVLKAAGSRYSVADPGTWAEQAALGAKGDWKAMEKLKKVLHKGKRK